MSVHSSGMSLSNISEPHIQSSSTSQPPRFTPMKGSFRRWVATGVEGVMAVVVTRSGLGCGAKGVAATQARGSALGCEVRASGGAEVTPLKVSSCGCRATGVVGGKVVVGAEVTEMNGWELGSGAMIATGSSVVCSIGDKMEAAPFARDAQAVHRPSGWSARQKHAQGSLLTQSSSPIQSQGHEGGRAICKRTASRGKAVSAFRSLRPTAGGPAQNMSSVATNTPTSIQAVG
mmetsp:Transcript_116551/g.341058  ORF Transcript_116551/g.341058 Transcript_116551/m.341058 type:complete len:232 (+) Transcript_116551:1120-1815(+)